MGNLIPLDSKIAIIGAGPGGIYTAYELQQKGYTNITVLEKNNYIGGKARTLKESGYAFDMGAVVVPNPGYSNVWSLIQEFNLDVETLPGNILIDPTNGKTGPLTNLNPPFEQLLKSYEQLACYPFLDAPGFSGDNAASAIPTELTKPCSDWLRKNKMQDLEDMLLIPITCYGYGDLSKIPAVYVLKFLNFNAMSSLVCAILGQEALQSLYKSLKWTPPGAFPDYGSAYFLKDGMQTLMERIAAELTDSTVKTGVTIDSVTRLPADRSIQYVDAQGHIHSEKYDQLILALPPATRFLPFLDLDPVVELPILDQVTINHYHTGLVKASKFDLAVYSEILSCNGENIEFKVPASGTPINFTKFWEDPDWLVFDVSSDGLEDKSTIQKNIIANIEALGGKAEKFSDILSWNYFPHFTSEAFQARLNEQGDASMLYQELYSLQGYKNTYYTGGLMNFEIVERVFEYSKYLVGTYFVGS